MTAPGSDTRPGGRWRTVFLGAALLLAAVPTGAEEDRVLPFWETDTRNLGERAVKDAWALGLLFDLPAEIYHPVSEAAARPRGWLGVALQEAEPTDAAPSLTVTRVFPESAAHAAGLKSGDLIVGFQDRSLSSEPNTPVALWFRQQVAAAGPDASVVLDIKRGSERLQITARLTPPPSAPVRLRPFGRETPATRSAPSLLEHGLKAQNQAGAFSTFLDALRRRADEVVSTAVKGETYNPFRLSIVSSVLYRPLALPQAGQGLVAPLAAALESRAVRLDTLIAAGADALDLPLSGGTAPPAPLNLNEWLARLIETIVQAQAMQRAATAALSADEVEHLEHWVHAWMSSLERQEEAAPEEKQEDERRTLRWLQLAMKPDLQKLLAAGRSVAAALDPAALKRMGAADLPPVTFPDGWVVTQEPDRMRVQTPAGLLIIGGPGPNVHTEEAVLIVDLGGDDIYLNRAGGARPGRPVAVVVDLNGDDRYLTREPFSQGAGFLGVGVLLDLAGDDTYAADDLAQGVGVFGVGLLADLDGRDRYQCRALCQAGGTFGIGLLAEGGGADHYDAALLAQGFGFVKGYGALIDRAGDDRYFAGGRVPDFRQPEKATQSLAQGFGYGLRPWETLAGASGGIGILADRAGNDIYVADYFAQGASYWQALGILADGGGHDRYIAGRYAQGAGVHYSAGLLMDDAGEDEYLTHFGVSQGCGHDFGVGLLLDHGGHDRYLGGVLSQGVGNANGLGVLNDNGGNDQYLVRSNGQGWGHFDTLRGLGSFGFLFDTGGGTDTYVPAAAQNTITAPTAWSLRADTR